jgi:hypothetical protein
LRDVGATHCACCSCCLQVRWAQQLHRLLRVHRRKLKWVLRCWCCCAAAAAVLLRRLDLANCFCCIMARMPA